MQRQLKAGAVLLGLVIVILIVISLPRIVLNTLLSIGLLCNAVVILSVWISHKEINEYP